MVTHPPVATVVFHGNNPPRWVYKELEPYVEKVNRTVLKVGAVGILQGNYRAVAGTECNTVIELTLEHHAA